MAKNSDHRADGLESDNTGGVLSGLLAEEDDLDRRALWRLGSWGVGAVAAVVVAVMANQTPFGWKRDQMAAADLGQRAQQIQNVANQTEREARRLAAAIDTLNSDRDRLYTRVTSLEQGLDSVTGSIARQNSAAASPAPAPPSLPSPKLPKIRPRKLRPPPWRRWQRRRLRQRLKNPRPIRSQPNRARRRFHPLPRIRQRSLARKPSRPSCRRSKQRRPSRQGLKPPNLNWPKLRRQSLKRPKPEAVKSDTAKIDTVKLEAAKADAATPATPLVASKSFMAPPDPSATKLIEPDQAPESGDREPDPGSDGGRAGHATPRRTRKPRRRSPIQRTQFGVDLGTANSVPGLRALWRGLLKSRSNAPLAALRPIIVIKEGTNGLGMQLRLVAGPLNDAGAAARICAVLTENKRNCETAIFDGQRLSLTGDDSRACARAQNPRRAGAVRWRSAAAARGGGGAGEEAGNRRQRRAISSWFGKREANRYFIAYKGLRRNSQPVFDTP